MPIVLDGTAGITTPANEVSGNSTFNGALTQGVFTLTGTTPALNPDNGTIQVWAITDNSVPTDGLVDGQSMTLLIDDGADYTITWPSVVFAYGSAPTLATTGFTAIVLWKVESVLYGNMVGEYA